MWNATEPYPPTPPPGRRRLLAAALILGTLVAGPTPASGVAAAQGRGIAAFDAVDPFIGTRLDTSQNKGNSAYGNTWPGATVPFGMVQSSPTTYRSSDGDRKGGYEYTADKIRGFGMTRLSGTGCEGRYRGRPATPARPVRAFDVALTDDPDLEVPGSTPERVVLTPTEKPESSQAVTWSTAAALASGEVRVREAGTEQWRTVVARRSPSPSTRTARSM